MLGKDDLLSLLAPKPTKKPGRNQIDNSQLQQFFEALSKRTGLSETCFDTRAITDLNATTRASNESLGQRFVREKVASLDDWVVFGRVGVDGSHLHPIAKSLKSIFDGVCSVLVLCANIRDLEPYKIFYAPGRRELAEALADIFECDEGILEETGPFLQIGTNLRSETSVTIREGAERTLPKAFLLLAGISGTGKSRFVSSQAKAASNHTGEGTPENYCLVPVRPDWHEPSDLLGYVSRIDGTRYIATDFLTFVVKAWMAATDDNGQLKPVAEITTYWLCLDEMNLAPVEQYFADYLSILETGQWKDGTYHSAPLLSPGKLAGLDEATIGTLFKEVFSKSITEPSAVKEKKLWDLFLSKGVQLPPNLVVAGTVNMDETTHAFSRKVIDRALTLDFQEFFPNDFDALLSGAQVPHVTLRFPVLSQATDAEARNAISKTADPDGAKTVRFMKLVNSVLDGTPYELAYRSLNEALLSVACFGPYSSEEVNPDLLLRAIWDDFLMQKVLPRIEGDAAKLGSLTEVETDPSLPNSTFGSGTLLHRLHRELRSNEALGPIWEGEARPDILRVTEDPIVCRTRIKLEWMMRRLKANHFTDFWC